MQVLKILSFFLDMASMPLRYILPKGAPDPRPRPVQPKTSVTPLDLNDLVASLKLQKVEVADWLMVIRRNFDFFLGSEPTLAMALFYVALSSTP